MNIKEYEQVTKFVMSQAAINSSSDFIMVAYELLAKYYPGLAERTEPILVIEADNYHLDWSSNSVYSEYFLRNLNAENTYHSMIAYRIMLDYFLNDEMVSVRFNMDEGDKLGWKIYKELDTKYNFCRKQLENLNYLVEKESCV